MPLRFIPHICHFFFTQAKFLENKIYTEKTRKLRQNTQKIANFLRYYGKIHSKLPIFRVKSVKIYTGQKKFTQIYSWRLWQIWGMCWCTKSCKTTFYAHLSQIWKLTRFTRFIRKVFATKILLSGKLSLFVTLVMCSIFQND